MPIKAVIFDAINSIEFLGTPEMTAFPEY